MQWQANTGCSLALPFRPTAGLNRGKEVRHGPVEQVWLLQIDGVSALWEHRKARPGDVALHKHGWLDARLVLVSNHNQSGNLKRVQFVL